jgi:hypothetical protein
MTYTSKKINTGIYIVTFANGACVRIQRYEDGLWHTFDVKAEQDGQDGYWQTYCTKTDALADLIAHADQLI